MSASINLNIWLQCKVGQSSSVKEGFVRDAGNCIFSLLSHLFSGKTRATVPSDGAHQPWLPPERGNILLPWKYVPVCVPAPRQHVLQSPFCMMLLRPVHGTTPVCTSLYQSDPGCRSRRGQDGSRSVPWLLPCGFLHQL